ncbi:MAG: 3'(2'),5'-bisphosphate nucleotidase CysQ [Defluviicoccus sp.]|nr:3'(2'),5'-bisphosphate nucleotidase CysQ [Defluviicoccus sp.]
MRAGPALLDRIAAIAEDAGRAILRHYRSGVAVERKADSSPVTIADREAEALILRALQAIDPAVPAIAEEASAAGAAPAEGGERFWLVDPLDGTREFLGETDEFTVNIALIEDGVPVLGAVHAPALGETYGGLAPGAAWRSRRGGAREAISARTVPAEGPVVLSSRRHGDRARLAQLLAGMNVSAHRIVGSSLKFCLLAAGEGDLYPRYGETNEWDTAAGDAVLRAAGGGVRTTGGAPLAYGKPGFLNPEFIARGRDRS